MPHLSPEKISCPALSDEGYVEGSAVRGAAVGCSGRAAIAPTPPAPALTPSLFAPSATPAPTASPTPLPYPPALQVGEVTVYQPEYDAALQQVQAFSDAQEAAGAAALSAEQQQAAAARGLLDEALFAQAAAQDGFTLSAEQTQARIAHMTAAAGGQAALDTWLSTNGYAQDLLPHSLWLAAAAASMRDQILAALPAQAEQIRARQVILPDEAAAQQLAQQSAVDFTAAAYAYDPYTGGDLGYFARGGLVWPQVAEAAFALQPGEVSAPLQTPLGWHVIQVIDRQTLSLSPRQMQIQQEQALADAANELRAKADIHASVPLPPTPAPTPAAEGQPLYVIQPGDTFNTIAARLRVPVQTLADANPAADPSLLRVGGTLVMPGAGGLDGKVSFATVLPGEDAAALAARYHTSEGLLARLNRLTSPAQLFTGTGVALPPGAESGALSAAGQLGRSETLLEWASAKNLSPWQVALAGGSSPALTEPGKMLYSTQAAANSGTGASVSLEALGDYLAQISASGGAEPSGEPAAGGIDGLSFAQGQTVVVRVSAAAPAAPQGSLDGHALHFFAEGQLPGDWVALQGIGAMAEPGLMDLSLTLTSQQGAQTSYEETRPLFDGGFPVDPPLEVDPATIDPTITAPEDAQVAAAAAPATPERLFSGFFRPPTDTPGCTRSGYGNRRSFNGSAYIYYHSGMDYGVCAGDTIYAPAPGKVVFVGTLDVRGNAVIIDHGQGVYSGFWHQKELTVKVGDVLEAGQPVGIIGDTGRVTGEHLHWEVWVGGVPVNPLEWLPPTTP